MNFYDKVNSLCRQRGISITALAVELGFSKGAPTGWKTLSKPPRAANVKKIADYFGVSVDYLLGGTTTSTTENNKKIELSPKEEQLLEFSKTLSDEQIDLLLQMIKQFGNKK